MNETPRSQDLTRITLAEVLIIGMMFGSVWVMRPFLSSVVWATMIVIATWPLLLRLQRGFKGKRGPAVAVMTVALLLIFVVPLVGGVLAIANNASKAVAWVKGVSENGLPPVPESLPKLPLIGPKIAAAWTKASGPGGLGASLAPYAQQAMRWIAGRIGSIGTMIIQFIITVLLAAILYAKGEVTAAGVVRFARRLAGERGESSARLAAQAIRSVALGVVVTALVQAAAAGIGLAIARVPFAAALTAIVLFLCIAQLGPMLVLIPAVIWTFAKTGTGLGIFILVWSIPVSILDNFLRPVLIKRGVDLPILLVISGVIGGMIAFGVVGLFIGPVLLAVTYRLLESWVKDPIPGAPPGGSS